MNQYTSTNDGVIIYRDLTGNLGGVANDATVADNGVVSDVYALHQ